MVTWSKWERLVSLLQGNQGWSVGVLPLQEPQSNWGNVGSRQQGGQWRTQEMVSRPSALCHHWHPRNSRVTIINTSGKLKLRDNYTLGKYTFGKVTLGKYTLGKYTLGRVTLGKYTFRKVTFGKVTFGKYTCGKVPLGKYNLGKYTLGKYTLGKYTFRKYTFGKYTFGKYTFGRGEGGSPGRYVFNIHFYIELGQKMIQFNIQFKIKSNLFIQ